jgi:adenosylmethionine-8-amino-7-oxononanoate aminotransferase
MIKSHEVLANQTCENLQDRRYLDTLSGMWLSNIGHGRREVADAVHAQICQLGYAPDGSVHPTTLRLAARVAALAPDPASRVFFVSGGSQAVETAMKMAKKFHRSRGDAGRYKFISRRGSYHGATHGALSLGGGGGNNGAEYGPLPYGGVRVQGPDQYRNPFGGTDGRGDLECAREIERAILNEGPDTVAAVIGEPISASAGVHIPHPEYWPMVREICDRYGVLLICDEVITGFGRTGRMFATEHWGVVPDIIVVAKALTSGYVPIGAAIATKHVADAFAGPTAPPSTTASPSAGTRCRVPRASRTWTSSSASSSSGTRRTWAATFLAACKTSTATTSSARYAAGSA